MQCPVGVYNVEECEEGLHRVKIEDSEVCDIDTELPLKLLKARARRQSLLNG